MNVILVIDDDPEFRETMAEMLTSLGHRAITAAEGETGFRQFRAHRPDLIVTDILMPHREGLETIRRLRSIDLDVPIIAISGDGDYGSCRFLEAAREFGANHTLVKPFTLQQLEAAIGCLLGAKMRPASRRVVAEFSER